MGFQKGYVWIRPQFGKLFDGVNCAEYWDFIRFFLGSKFERQRVIVVEKSVAGTDGFDRRLHFKLYTHRKTWKFMGRASKAKCEQANYLRFERLGIRCATCAAYGEARDRWGWLIGAFIVTETIPEAVTLEELFGERHQRPFTDEVASTRRAILTQIAEFSRHLHDSGFVHRDLRFRNILVNGIDAGAPKVWWIDCPRGESQKPWMNRRRAALKDLATLDLDAAEMCSEEERMRFLEEYLGPNADREEMRRWTADITKYQQKRWGL